MALLGKGAQSNGRHASMIGLESRQGRWLGLESRQGRWLGMPRQHQYDSATRGGAGLDNVKRGIETNYARGETVQPQVGEETQEEKDRHQEYNTRNMLRKLGLGWGATTQKVRIVGKEGGAEGQAGRGRREEHR